MELTKERMELIVLGSDPEFALHSEYCKTRVLQPVVIQDAAGNVISYTVVIQDAAGNVISYTVDGDTVSCGWIDDSLAWLWHDSKLPRGN